MRAPHRECVPRRLRCRRAGPAPRQWPFTTDSTIARVARRCALAGGFRTQQGDQHRQGLKGAQSVDPDLILNRPQKRPMRRLRYPAAATRALPRQYRGQNPYTTTQGVDPICHMTP